MLAVSGPMPEDPEAWLFEYKWDGMRALAYWQNGELRLESRNLRDVTGVYPDLVPDPASMPEQDAILDGEIVALDARGRPSFKALQQRMHASPARAAAAAERTPVQFYLFDCLWHAGASLLEQPLQQRRAVLEGLRLDHRLWRVPAAHKGEGPAMLTVAREWSLEGLLAKRPGSAYRPGARGREWRKIKLVRHEELVVGGWEPREQRPDQVGALLLGHYEPGGLKLRFAGRVGTGFDAGDHQRLAPLLRERERDSSPFAGSVGRTATRFVEPDLVAQVAYRRWPGGGHLQQASFQGLRPDKPARDVVLEHPGDTTGEEA
jgi:bifunctional non-homologous end joining protein LigD